MGVVDDVVTGFMCGWKSGCGRRASVQAGGWSDGRLEGNPTAVGSAGLSCPQASAVTCTSIPTQDRGGLRLATVNGQRKGDRATGWINWRTGMGRLADGED